MVLKGSFPEVLRRCKPGLAACKTRTFNFILPPPQRQDSLFSSGLMRFLCNLLPHCTVSHSVGLSFVIRVLVSITLRLSSGGKKTPTPVYTVWFQFFFVFPLTFLKRSCLLDFRRYFLYVSMVDILVSLSIHVTKSSRHQFKPSHYLSFFVCFVLFIFVFVFRPHLVKDKSWFYTQELCLVVLGKIYRVPGIKSGYATCKASSTHRTTSIAPQTSPF